MGYLGGLAVCALASPCLQPWARPPLTQLSLREFSMSVCVVFLCAALLHPSIQEGAFRVRLCTGFAQDLRVQESCASLHSG